MTSVQMLIRVVAVTATGVADDQYVGQKFRMDVCDAGCRCAARELVSIRKRLDMAIACAPGTPFRNFPRPPVTHGRIPHTLMLPPATTSDSPCNWSQTNHVQF